MLARRHFERKWVCVCVCFEAPRGRIFTPPLLCMPLTPKFCLKGHFQGGGVGVCIIRPPSKDNRNKKGVEEQGYSFPLTLP